MKKFNAIALCGAQGTGKTTILNNLIDDDRFEIHSNIVRGLNLPKNDDSDEAVQEAYFKHISGLYEDVKGDKIIVGDRSPVDVYAYTCRLFLLGKVSKQFVSDQYDALYDWMERNPGVLLGFTPVEFPMEEDGVRNAETRDFINIRIDSVINSLRCFYPNQTIVLKGTVEERLDTLKNALK